MKMHVHVEQARLRQGGKRRQRREKQAKVIQRFHRAIIPANSRGGCLAREAPASSTHHVGVIEMRMGIRRVAMAGLLTALGGTFMNADATESEKSDKDGTVYATLESLDPRFDALIAPDTKIEKIADDLLWSEGPIWEPRSKSLLFSDIPRNR